MKEQREDAPSKVRNSSPEVVLSEVGLARSDDAYLLGDEGSSVDQFRKASATLRDGLAITRELGGILENDAWIVNLRQQRNEAEFYVRTAQNYLNSIPSRGNNLIVDEYNRAKAVLASWKNDFAIIDRDLKQRLTLSPGPARRQELVRRKEQLEDRFREEVAELRRLVDSTNAKYAQLASDANVTAALEDLKKSRRGVKLGPSHQLRGITEELPKIERKILPAM